MRQEVGSKVTSHTSGRSVLRGVGRAAIWIVLALLLVRGVLAGPAGEATAPTPSTGTGADQKTSAFAIRFARSYLSDPASAALAPFLAVGVRVGGGRPPQGGGLVAQAEVEDTEELGDGRAILTVACELRDSRTLYLAVPIVRTEAGEVAALGAPSIVADPDKAGVDSEERPQPLSGDDAGEIEALAGRFLPAYIASSEASDLAYFLTAGTEVQPLGGTFELAAISEVRQLGPGEGGHREVLVAARLADPDSGASYPVVYRLQLVRRDRWYVRAIEGAVA